MHILLLGSGGVGAKTSLLYSFKYGEYVEGYEPTIEDVYRVTIEVDGETTVADVIGLCNTFYTLLVFFCASCCVGSDTAGQEEYDTMRDQAFEKADAVILGFDVTSRHSFDRAFDLLEMLNNYCDSHGKERPIIVAVGNKIDLVNSREVNTEEARRRFGNMNPPLHYIETSAKTGENVKDVFEYVAKQWRLRLHEKKCMIQ